MKSATSTVKVGILTLVSLFLLVFVLIWLRGRGLGDGVSYNVNFKDVDGLKEGAAVQLMGIRLGFVDKVEPQMINGKYYVHIKFSIDNPDIKIPTGSRLTIEQSGLVGDKFLEITPPILRQVTVTSFNNKELNDTALVDIPVKFLYEEGLMVVGRVEKVEKSYDENMVHHKLSYRITRPGADMPKDPLFALAQDENHQYFLRILPTEPVTVQAPETDLLFTIENPLRLKRFLEIQLESADALKITNQKINELLSDETIASLNNTVKNTEMLTGKATELLDTANTLFRSSNRDLEKLVKASDELARNVTVVTNNVNDVIGNPQVKADLAATISSIQQSTKTLSEIIQDPSIKETLALTQATSKDAAELVRSLKKTATDKELQDKLNNSLTLLNDSLTHLSTVLNNVDVITNDKDKSINGIVKDTKETTENLKKFSQKLKGHFTLFRLLF